MALRITKVETGEIRGVPAGSNRFTVFKSVPYAAPPTGPLRFQKPRPAEKWQGIYSAEVFKPIAAQVPETHPFYSNEFYRYREEMSEDCLYLSIWTPADSAGEGLPVLVFFHGGAFQSGYHYEMTIDGEFFCRQGIVFVSVDYRLGALGYMAHPELTAENGGQGSGNWGVHDQIAALGWIKRNIKAFGGDPDRMTISGQSAGAISTSILLNTPFIKEGDIAGAILESGGGLDSPATELFPMLSLKDAEQAGERFLDFLGVSDIGEARKLDWRYIVSKQREFSKSPEGCMFSPCIDHVILNMPLYESIRQKKQLNVPIILGTNADESGADLYTVSDPEKFREDCIRRYGKDTAAEFLEIIRFRDDPPEAARLQCLNDGLQPQILAFCEYQSGLKDRKNTWLYYFTRELPGDMPAGAYHSSELWYVFHTIDRCDRPLTGTDYELANTVGRYWGNFVKHQNPNGAGQKEWSPYTTDSPCAMEFGESTGMLHRPGSERSRFLADYILRH